LQPHPSAHRSWVACFDSCLIRLQAARTHAHYELMIGITCHIKPRRTAGDTGMCSHCGTQPASIHTTLHSSGTLSVVTQVDRQARVQSAMVTSRHRSQQQHTYTVHDSSCVFRVLHATCTQTQTQHMCEGDALPRLVGCTPSSERLQQSSVHTCGRSQQ
jgi:hypothetical protein